MSIMSVGSAPPQARNIMSTTAGRTRFPPAPMRYWLISFNNGSWDRKHPASFCSTRSSSVATSRCGARGTLEEKFALECAKTLKMAAFFCRRLSLLYHFHNAKGREKVKEIVQLTGTQ